MKKNNIGKKKSSKQIADYKNFIQKSTYSPDGTIENENKMLLGSEHIFNSSEAIKQDTRYKKKPIKYWLKDNWVQSIIATLFTMAVGYALSFIIDTNSEIAVINQKIITIEQAIISLDNSKINKDNLQMQLDNIKSDIENSYKLSINDINWQLKNIEKELDKIREKLP